MNIISRYLELCLLKKSPADLPVSNSLLKLSLLSYFLIGVALSSIDNTWAISIFTSLTDMLFMMAAVVLLLKYKHLQSRYHQTLSALAGTGSCLGLISLPIMIWFSRIDEAQQATSFAMMSVILLMFWSLIVTAHIFRHALDIKASSAALLTVLYTILSLLLLGLTMSGVA